MYPKRCKSGTIHDRRWQLVAVLGSWWAHLDDIKHVLDGDGLKVEAAGRVVVSRDRLGVEVHGVVSKIAHQLRVGIHSCGHGHGCGCGDRAVGHGHM